MKTSEIQKQVCKTEILKGNLVCENVAYLFDWECDVLTINKTGYVSEFEVKISRSDFLAEKKKARKWMHANLKSESFPNYFWYVCPTDLIKASEIPDYAGLIYIEESGSVQIKKPSLIHKGKRDRLKVLTMFSRIFAERSYLGSCKLTYLNKQRRK